MGIKSRDPNNLKHSDYVSWFLEFLDTRGRLIASGEWPMHLEVDFAGLYDVYKNAYADFEAKEQYLVIEATPAHKAAAKKVFLRIRSFKQLLPTLFGGDETVLTEFAINEAIPSDKDDLYIMAKNCIDHWTELCDPAMPPEYAPVEAFFTEYATEFADFEAAHEAHIDATREKEIAETVADETRAPCHAAERLVFHWFKGIYLDSKDPWWADTMWGCSCGGGSGGSGTKWDDVPGEVKIQFVILGKEMLVVSAPGYTGAVGFDVRLGWGPTGGEPPTMSGENTLTNVPFPVQYTEEIFHGMTCYAWIRARKGEEVTGWSEPASVDVP